MRTKNGSLWPVTSHLQQFQSGINNDFIYYFCFVFCSSSSSVVLLPIVLHFIFIDGYECCYVGLYVIASGKKHNTFADLLVETNRKKKKYSIIFIYSTYETKPYFSYSKFFFHQAAEVKKKNGGKLNGLSMAAGLVSFPIVAYAIIHVYSGELNICTAMHSPVVTGLAMPMPLNPIDTLFVRLGNSAY